MTKFYYLRTTVLLVFTGCLIAFVLYAAAQNANDGNKDFDRQAMLDNIALNIFLPLHEDFVGKAEALNQAVEAFCSRLKS